MPELPEVETVCRGLHRALEGDSIADVILNHADMRFAFAPDLQERLIGARIERIARRAKYLLFTLDSGDTLIGHLGMSGTMRIEAAATYQARVHDHVLIEMASGQLFIFRDPRRFGFLLLSPSAQLQAHPMIAHLGPEPLGPDFTPDYLKHALKKRTSAVKVALMDQKLVVGVGNIYASEALFRARVSPFLPASEAAAHAFALVKAIQTVLGEAIDSGGSTLRDFSGATGSSGYFQHAFAVYDRAGQACISCKQPLRQARQSGRSTFFCIDCQLVSESDFSALK